MTADSSILLEKLKTISTQSNYTTYEKCRKKTIWQL